MATYDTGKIILFVRSVLWDLNIPQEAATLLYEDNDGCTAMDHGHITLISNTSPCVNGLSVTLSSSITPIPQSTCLTTSPNLCRHFFFHRHADFLLGHVPPSYSPLYSNIVGKYTNHTINVNKFIPTSFTTPLTAAAALIYAPVKEDYAHSPWLQILGHGDTIQYSHDSSLLPSSFNHIIHSGLWGGVTIGS